MGVAPLVRRNTFASSVVLLLMMTMMMMPGETEPYGWVAGALPAVDFWCVHG